MRYVFMRYPEGRAKAVTFSYDDGVLQDVRLAELFYKRGLKATFNMSSERLRPRNFTAEEIEENFFAKGHEVAIHGALHRASGSIRAIEGIREVLDNRLELEEKCGRIIRGMAYPDTGITRLNNISSYAEIKQYLTELDIAYARTLAGDNDEFALPTDFHAWMPSAHHTNPALGEYVDKFLAIDTAVGVYRARREPRLLYIWGHSYEFDRDENWEMFEAVCDKLAGHDEIWYATNIEIYDYVTAYRSLIYSANGRRIYNPTLLEVWFDADGKLYSIKPGETLVIEE